MVLFFVKFKKGNNLIYIIYKFKIINRERFFRFVGYEQIDILVVVFIFVILIERVA
jgi:hypothetical protein